MLAVQPPAKPADQTTLASRPVYGVARTVHSRIMAARALEGGDSLRSRWPPSRARAFAGGILSPRELQTIKAMARGLTYEQAAEEYGWLDAVPEGAEIIELADRRRVTWAQRWYLKAFDQALRAGGDPDEVARTRLLREGAVTGVYREAGIHRKRDAEQRRRQVAATPQLAT